MLVFDEKKYAEKIMKNKKYETVKTQGRERCILVRYLTHMGKSYDEIMDTLFKLPMSGGEYLTRQEKRSIYDRIIKILGQPGASEKAARQMIAILKNNSNKN